MEIGQTYKVVFQADKTNKCIFGKLLRILPDEKAMRFIEIETKTDKAIFIINTYKIIEMKKISDKATAIGQEHEGQEFEESYLTSES